MHPTTYNAKAYSAGGATSRVASTTIKRRDPTDRDVRIEILFCGICHSDLHSVRNEWSEFMATNYPIVPGHEIVGRVTEVGSAVAKFKPGDLVAVGCMVDSDGTCANCKAGLEQFCPNMILTFNSPDKHLGGLPTAAIRKALSSMNISFCASHPISTSQGPRHCFALELRRTRRCVTGASAKARKWAWPVSAARPYGREVCSRVRSPRRCLHHFT